MATFIAATVPVEQAGATSQLLEDARRIGEGVLLQSESTDREDLDKTPEGHQYNSFEKVMQVFGGGQGGVQITRAG